MGWASHMYRDLKDFDTGPTKSLDIRNEKEFNIMCLTQANEEAKVIIDTLREENKKLKDDLCSLSSDHRRIVEELRQKFNKVFESQRQKIENLRALCAARPRPEESGDYAIPYSVRLELWEDKIDAAGREG